MESIIIDVGQHQGPWIQLTGLKAKSIQEFVVHTEMVILNVRKASTVGVPLTLEYLSKMTESMMILIYNMELEPSIIWHNRS